jgi:lipopolysaccharide transport system ATP-binding protein
MSNDIVIKVEHVSKRYEIGEKSNFVTLRDQLMELPQRLFKGPKRTKEFLALRDVSFEVKRGEVVGIIGRNGAGKSTLLKILARITEPTSGRITMHGRVASMLEVGTGFNPELTGRENIYLNGAIIGMKKKEIESKFNDIVQFSGVDKFLDTPVKHYSSGMYVRLAFAVAAHLDADILLVDEVLAVGDAEFQKKCFNKMRTLAHGGRTVIFISHDLGAINNLCSQVILMDKGEVKDIGSSTSIIEKYYDSTTTKLGVFQDNKLTKSDLVSLKSLTIKGLLSKKIGVINFQDGLVIDLRINLKSNLRAVTGISITDHIGQIVTTIHTKELGVKGDIDPIKNDPLLSKGEHSISLKIANFPVRPGKYYVYCSIFSRSKAQNIYSSDPVPFLVSEAGHNRLFDERQQGTIFPASALWEIT